jgi:hypothetical protein
MRDGKGVVSSCISARRWRHTAALAGKKTEKKKRGREETQQRASDTEREREMFGFLGFSQCEDL